MGRLENKVAVVTGAGTASVRRSLCDLRAKARASRSTITRMEMVRTQTLEQVRAAGSPMAPSSKPICALLMRRGSVVERAAEHFGRLDILVNNSGSPAGDRFWTTPRRPSTTCVDTNLKGSYFASQAAARQFIRQAPRADHPDLIAGRGQRRAVSERLLDDQSGLRMLARSLGFELGRYGITVNAIGVGPTLNERNLRDDPDYDAHWGEVVPVGRAATADDACWRGGLSVFR